MPSASIVIDCPAGTARDDILVAQLSVRRSASVAAPPGWTTVQPPAVDDVATFAVLWKRATASEPRSYTFALSAGAGGTGTIDAFSGAVATGDPFGGRAWAQRSDAGLPWLPAGPATVPATGLEATALAGMLQVAEAGTTADPSPVAAGNAARRSRTGITSKVVAVAVALAVVLGLGAAVRAAWRPASLCSSGGAAGPPASVSQGQGASATSRSGTPGSGATAPGARFVTSVSANGRYFQDQYGQPLLVHADSSWSLLPDLSLPEMERWFTNRASHGFNAALMSVVTTSGSGGGPSDSGDTFDGVNPFTTPWAITSPNPKYWARVDAMVDLAASQGITLFLYAVDTFGQEQRFEEAGSAASRAYGEFLGNRYHSKPNIVWMTGGDYAPSDWSRFDPCLTSVYDGIKATDPDALWSAQLIYQKSNTHDDPVWESRADFSFTYTYWPAYYGILEAYNHRWPTSPRFRPAIYGEGQYEREESGGIANTDETLRRQMLWSLTSGAAADFYGSSDWTFKPGWQTRLDTPAVRQLQRLTALFVDLKWYRLVPDQSNELVTSGRGTFAVANMTAGPSGTMINPRESSYVTAARTPTGSTAVIYLPTARTITVDQSKMSGTVTSRWVDPTTGASTTTATASNYTTPGRNAGGSQDWLLILQGQEPARGSG